MRTHQPRQLKPYAFDQLEYKHQLKHHLDAIVKLNGYRSPVESSSPPPLSQVRETPITPQRTLEGKVSLQTLKFCHAQSRRRGIAQTQNIWLLNHLLHIGGRPRCRYLGGLRL